MNSLKGEITLLSLGQNPCELGLRYLSSVLKQNNYAVNKLFMKQRLETDVSLEIIEQINEFSKNSLFIGISMMTDNVILAKNYAKKIKQVNKSAILVAGGIHSTVRPDEVMDVFDIVVKGEAEQVILTLVDKLFKNREIKDIRLPAVSTSYYNSDAIGFMKDIDTIPHPDFSDNFVFKKGRICLEKDYGSLFGDYYPILTSRGCPYACTYCVNNFYLENINERFFRKRSVDKIIDELNFVKKKYGINRIAFLSDNFLSFSESEIDDFVSLYEEKIDLPFVCCAAPNCIKESHINKLMKIGLTRISLGIESGSENTLSKYKRNHGSPQKIIEAASILHKFYPKLNYSFDLILDNPYETKEDINKTLSLLESMPKTYDLTLFSLTFYPGTYLYDKAVKDGLIEESYYLKKSKYYHRLNKYFYNFIFLLYALKVNQKLIAYFTKCEHREDIIAKICRKIAVNLIDILLGLCLLKMISFSIRNRNKALIFHYIKLGFQIIKSTFKSQK